MIAQAHHVLELEPPDVSSAPDVRASSEPSRAEPIREPLEAIRARHAEVLADLEELRKECAEANWDGYDAFPLSEESARLAARAIESIILGFGLPSPSLGAEPDGCVTLDWCGTPGHEFSISVNPAGAYHYSTVLGSELIFGELPISTEFPARLRALIREVVAG